MEASSSKLLADIQSRQRHLQFDDPINIQFTSVRCLSLVCYISLVIKIYKRAQTTS